MVAQNTPGGGNTPRNEDDVKQDNKPPESQASNEAPGEEDVMTEAEVAEVGAEASDQKEMDPLAVLRAEADSLREEVAELKDQLLRALAETENVRNRARREREEALRYAAAPLAKDLLPVADNLRRAIESVGPEAAAEDERLNSLRVGVEMTEKGLLDTLAKHGVARIDPLGERLDPHRHEAMMEIPDPSKPAGTVAQVFEVGYVLHDRLLRPARVGVAAGGPTATQEAQEAGETKEEG
ncbi:MAG TPA: nucleotide exchange factor GrpE [Kiloniellales bacterium]|jgi:molecular chaperone GrpE|nr:nucleotide exchange factor GrpE [Kiloniellales bacterium]